MITKRIDRLVEWTKWPAAWFAVASSPFLLVAIANRIWESLDSPVYLVMFFAGLGLLWFASRTSFANSFGTKLVFRWLHDATQTFVSMLMLHPIVSIRKNDASPELPRIRWLGKGNWVMLASPYIFPLSTAVLWLVSLVLFAPLRSFVLGLGLGLHLSYVLYQAYQGTSELRRLGKRFCWMFLPVANAAVVGLVFSFAIDGIDGVRDFLVDAITLPNRTWSWISDLLTGNTARSGSTLSEE